MRMHRRGLALILVAGVLGLLAVLGLAFVTMAQLERKASRQRLYATKAMLLARSGIEDAVARLSAGQDLQRVANRYGGEDWDADGSFSAYEKAEQVFNPTSTTADTATCPVRHAMRPSFPVMIPGASNPVTQRVEGRLRGYSGRLSDDLASVGNVYALKVEDESAKINVNGGFLDGGDRDGDTILDHHDLDVFNPADPSDRGRGWNKQLTRVLNLLGVYVGVAQLGTKTLSQRPVGGYGSIEELQQAIGTPIDLSPYLTAWSWPDPAVVHPNPLSGNISYQAANDLKLDRGPLKLEEHGRSPVNLNAADPLVLQALLSDLWGMAWEGPESPCFAVSVTQGFFIANAMVSRRRNRPFSSWFDLSVFLDGLAEPFFGRFPTASGENCYHKVDLIKACLDPNTALNKEIPDQLRWRRLDKSDLVNSSTEGCFEPTGVFKVACTGRLLSQEGRILAQTTISQGVEVFRPFRHSTQADFVGGRGSLETYLAPVPDILPVPLAYGSLTTGASALWKTWPGVDRGLTAMTYPCNPMCLPAKAADFDGAVGLATVELDESLPAGALSDTFLHHLDDTWRADVAGGAPALQTGKPPDAKLQIQVQESAWPVSGSEPCTLYPDGLHVQRERSPVYRALGNLPSDDATSTHGALFLWSKRPNLGSNRVAVTCGRVDQWSQVLAVGFSSSCFGLVIESGSFSGDNRHEGQQLFESLPLPGYSVATGGPRWLLLGALWDTDESTLDDQRRFQVRGFPGEPFREFADPTTDYVFPMFTSDCTALVDATCTLVLGLDHTIPGFLAAPSGIAAHSVTDEMAIMDFGDLPGPAFSAFETWMDDAWKAGRYYKGAGRYLSPEILAGTPARILRTAWTEYLPRENRIEVRGINGAIPAKIRGFPRGVDPDLQDDPSGNPRAWIELELLDAGATLDSPALQPLTQGGRVGRMMKGFQYRARFRSNLESPLDEPLLESPWLDDITFTCQPAGYPRVLSHRVSPQ